MVHIHVPCLEVATTAAVGHEAKGLMWWPVLSGYDRGGWRAAKMEGIGGGTSGDSRGLG